MRPQIPGLSPGGLGPHLTSSGFPCGLSSGFPFARRVLPLRPPSSGFPSSGVLRFVPFGRCPVPVSPSVSLRVPFPLGNLHVSAAAGRFRRRRSQTAGTKVTSSAATTSPGSRDPPALSDGQRLGTMGCRHRIAGYERRRAEDIAAPEPPRTADLLRERAEAGCSSVTGFPAAPAPPVMRRWSARLTCEPGASGHAEATLGRSSPRWRTDIGADQVKQPQLMTT